MVDSPQQKKAVYEFLIKDSPAISFVRAHQGLASSVQCLASFSEI